MALLGNKLQQAYSATAKDTFNGDGSTVAFTLSRPSRTNDVEVFVENVQQEPTVAYAVSGTTLTFTEAPVSGTGNIYVIHRTQATQSLTVNTDDITDGAITAAKIADGAVSSTAVSGSANTATDFFALPKGTTAQRPASPDNGYIRYNTTEGYIEEYRGGIWQALSNVFSATGGTETTYEDGGITYKVHTFTSSGTFEVLSGTSDADYIIVAGGGGGGGSYQSPGAGGGGAGGFINATSQSFIAGAFSVVVGAGGTAGVGDGNSVSAAPSNGVNSSFNGSTAIGGGRGGVYNQHNAGDGGSGGGGSYVNGPGTGTSGQGNNGGNSTGTSNDQNAGGGGGYGSVGGNATSSVGGAGGTGVSSSITGSALFYSGGGGGGGGYNNDAGGLVGGAGGSGVGGDGGTSGENASTIVGGNGQANRGGGGGGAGGPTGSLDQTAHSGGNGGSGVVIIRYAV